MGVKKFVVYSAAATLGVGIAGYKAAAFFELPFQLPVEISTGMVGDTEQGLICAANTTHCTAANALGVLATQAERPQVATKDISPFFLRAIVAIEDRRFFSNNGCDVWAGLRAVSEDLLHQKKQGGSGVTRQFVSNRNPHQSTIFAEYQECGMAMRLEEELTARYTATTASQAEAKAKAKEVILSNHVNDAYYGRGAYGIEEAAQQFFGVHAKNLTLEQSAVLAGTTQLPSVFGVAFTPDMITPKIAKSYDTFAAKLQAKLHLTGSPSETQIKVEAALQQKGGALSATNADNIITYSGYLANSAALRNRYIQVVDALALNDPDLVSAQKAAEMKKPENFPILIQYTPINKTGTSFTVADKFNARPFTNFVLKDASNILTKKKGTAVSTSDVASGQYTIYTTLDTRDQTALNNAIQKDKRTAALEAAGISLDAQGNIKAMVGSKNYKKVGINMAAGVLGGGSGRDAGSSNKPYALAYLYANGLPTDKKIKVPVSVTIKQKGQKPWIVNSGDGCSSLGKKAPCMMYPAEALAISSDTWAAETVKQTGIDPIVANMNELGMNVPKPYTPALILGATAMAPLNEAVGMNGLVLGKGTATFYDGQAYSAITKIVDSRTGAVIYQRPAAQTKQVFTLTVAKATIEAMKQVVNARYGTAYGTMYPSSGPDSVAGKTGTSSVEGSKSKASKDLWFTASVCDKKPNLERTTSIWAGNAVGETAIPSYFFGSDIAKIVGKYFATRPHTAAACDIAQ